MDALTLDELRDLRDERRRHHQEILSRLEHDDDY